MGYEYRAWWRFGTEAPVQYGTARSEHWACAEDIPDDAPIGGIEVRAVLPWEESTLVRHKSRYGEFSMEAPRRNYG